jgi:RNA 2',3'-cyclic 3'-phosphodiesterase
VEHPLSQRRLFFAFWPDETLRGALEAARARLFPLAGRPVDPANLHVTVAFLGAVDESKLARLAELAGPVAPLPIVFDRLEHWTRPRVLAAVASQPPPRLRAIVDGLWQRLDRLGFAREPRPYVPHLTLVRDVKTLRAGLAWPPLEWTVYRIQLVESVATPAGMRYSPLG